MNQMAMFEEIIKVIGFITAMVAIISLAIWMHYSMVKYAADNLIDERVKKECLLKQ